MRSGTARVRVEPSGREFAVEGNESLLEAALRAGVALSYGCSNGNCGQCKAKCLSGESQKIRHYDYVMTEAEKNARILLMCCNAPLTDMVIEAREAHGATDMPLQKIAAKVKALSAVSEGIRLLHLQTPRSNRLRFLAGQSVCLTLGDGSTRTCAVASCPCDERNLEFHIERCPADGFSEALFNRLKTADAVRVEGPRGEFVLNEDSTRPRIFLAFDSGFAPVKSLIEHAMALDTPATLRLYWVASADIGHYLDNRCRSWADALDNFGYVPLTANGALSQQAVQDAIARMIQEEPDLKGCDIYVSGPAPLAHEAGQLLLEHEISRPQLFVNPLPAC